MRSPLVSIGGFARLLKEKEKDEPKHLSHINVIIEEVNRLEKIIKDILDFVRPFKLTFSEINVKKSLMTCSWLIK